MNAELPAFDPNQVDAAFAEALEEDGLPVISQPAALGLRGRPRRRRSRSFRAAAQRRRLRAREVTGKAVAGKNNSQRLAALLATAGLRRRNRRQKSSRTRRRRSPSTPSWANWAGRTSSPSARRWECPAASCCDRCGAVTPRVCACGVSFCSRACLKEAWPSTRRRALSCSKRARRVHDVK